MLSIYHILQEKQHFISLYSLIFSRLCSNFYPDKKNPLKMEFLNIDLNKVKSSFTAACRGLLFAAAGAGFYFLRLCGLRLSDSDIAMASDHWRALVLGQRGNIAQKQTPSCVRSDRCRGGDFLRRHNTFQVGASPRRRFVVYFCRVSYRFGIFYYASGVAPGVGKTRICPLYGRFDSVGFFRIIAAHAPLGIV